MKQCYAGFDTLIFIVYGSLPERFRLKMSSIYEHIADDEPGVKLARMRVLLQHSIEERP